MTDSTIPVNFYQSEENRPISRVALLVEYCGLEFRGSQAQRNQPTVQAAVEIALQQLNLKTSAVSFASRTDAGVNAFGQVAHFDVTTDALVNVPNLASALNAVVLRFARFSWNWAARFTLAGMQQPNGIVTKFTIL